MNQDKVCRTNDFNVRARARARAALLRMELINQEFTRNSREQLLRLRTPLSYSHLTLFSNMPSILIRDIYLVHSR